MDQICAECNTSVTKILKPIKRKDKRKSYTDGMGRQWYGKKCPDCRANNQAKRYKKINYSDI